MTTDDRHTAARMRAVRRRLTAACFTAALLATSAAAHAATVTVAATATGGFGSPNDGFTDLVVGYTFSSPGTIALSAPGTINTLNGDAGFDATADGNAVFFTGPLSFYQALEEAAVDAGTLTLPRTNFTASGGELMGAFISAAQVAAPGFAPRDSDLGGGIDATDLFFIGSSNTFTAPGAGTLFLGVNDSRAGNNVGAFSVQVVPLPGAVWLLGSAVVGLALRRRVRRAVTTTA